MPASARPPAINVALRKPMTHAGFLGWAETQNEQYEFDGFQPVAMTGRSRLHARIGGNIFGDLRERLRGNACEPFNGDAGIQTIGEAVRYPDCVVSCAPEHDRDWLVSNPVVVFEVVSPTSIREHRILKPDEYALVPSIKRYVIVEQTVIGATVLWRESDEPWRFQTLKAGDTLALPEIGVELPLDSFYERVNVDEPLSA